MKVWVVMGLDKHSEYEEEDYICGVYSTEERAWEVVYRLGEEEPASAFWVEGYNVQY